MSGFLPPPARGLHGAARFAAMVRVLPHRGRKLFHARRRLLERRSLLFGAFRQVGVTERDLTRPVGDGFSAGADLADDVREFLVHFVERGPYGLAAADNSPTGEKMQSEIPGADAIE